MFAGTLASVRDGGRGFPRGSPVGGESEPDADRFSGLSRRADRPAVLRLVRRARLPLSCSPFERASSDNVSPLKRAGITERKNGCGRPLTGRTTAGLAARLWRGNPLKGLTAHPGAYLHDPPILLRTRPRGSVIRAEGQAPCLQNTKSKRRAARQNGRARECQQRANTTGINPVARLSNCARLAGKAHLPIIPASVRTELKETEE